MLVWARKKKNFSAPHVLCLQMALVLVYCGFLWWPWLLLKCFLHVYARMRKITSIAGITGTDVTMRWHLLLLSHSLFSCFSMLCLGYMALVFFPFNTYFRFLSLCCQNLQFLLYNTNDVPSFMLLCVSTCSCLALSDFDIHSWHWQSMMFPELHVYLN